MARELMITGGSPRASIARSADYLNKHQAGQIVRNYIAPFYDTGLKASVSAGTIAAETLTLFTAGIGGSTGDPIFATTTGSKTYTSTNLQTSGGIFPSGQAFAAESMGIAIIAAITSGNFTQTTAYAQYANDVAAIAYGTEVFVGGGTTTIPLGTIAHWPAGFGITGVTGGNSTANGVTQHGASFSNGMPQHVARMRFSQQPIAFNSQQAFQFTLRSETATQQILAQRSCVQVAWWGTFTDQLGG